MPEPFRQWWFAGNHSDIGGSYPEDESRLSDIALEWMADEAASLPHSLTIDWSKLHLFPLADGVQHCEVEGLLDAYPWWVPRRLRRGWKASPRMVPAGAPYHPSVLDRLALPGVLKSGAYGPYRPEGLRTDPALSQYYRSLPGIPTVKPD